MFNGRVATEIQQQLLIVTKTKSFSTIAIEKKRNKV